MWAAYDRRGSFLVRHPRRDIFPLLCPKAEEDCCRLEFSQTFVPTSEPGLATVERLVREDFQGRLDELARLMEAHLSAQAVPGAGRERRPDTGE